MASCTSFVPLVGLTLVSCTLLLYVVFTTPVPPCKPSEGLGEELPTTLRPWVLHEELQLRDHPGMASSTKDRNKEVFHQHLLMHGSDETEEAIPWVCPRAPPPNRGLPYHWFCHPSRESITVTGPNGYVEVEVLGQLDNTELYVHMFEVGATGQYNCSWKGRKFASVQLREDKCFCPDSFEEFSEIYECHPEDEKRVEDLLAAWLPGSVTWDVFTDPVAVRSEFSTMIHFAIIDNIIYYRKYNPKETHPYLHVLMSLLSSVLRKVKLPDVEFYWHAYDDPNQDMHITGPPVLAFCSIPTYFNDVLLPSPDVIKGAFQGTYLEAFTKVPSWNERIPSAYFRGKNTGYFHVENETHLVMQTRWRAAMLARQEAKAAAADVASGSTRKVGGSLASAGDSAGRSSASVQALPPGGAEGPRLLAGLTKEVLDGTVRSWSADNLVAFKSDNDVKFWFDVNLSDPQAVARMDVIPTSRLSKFSDSKVSLMDVKVMPVVMEALQHEALVTAMKLNLTSRREPDDEHSYYKYVLNLDGNTAPWRTCSILASGALMIKQRSPYKEHFYDLLKPGVHFLEVDHNLRDLVEVIKWAQKNDDAARKMALAARQLFFERLQPKDLLCWTAFVLRSIRSKLAFTPERRYGMKEFWQPSTEPLCCQSL